MIHERWMKWIMWYKWNIDLNNPNSPWTMNKLLQMIEIFYEPHRSINKRRTNWFKCIRIKKKKCSLFVQKFVTVQCFKVNDESNQRTGSTNHFDRYERNRKWTILLNSTKIYRINIKCSWSKRNLVSYCLWRDYSL